MNVGGATFSPSTGVADAGPGNVDGDVVVEFQGPNNEMSYLMTASTAQPDVPDDYALSVYSYANTPSGYYSLTDGGIGGAAVPLPGTLSPRPTPWRARTKLGPHGIGVGNDPAPSPADTLLPCG